jgi:hypothetical protein
MSPRSSLAHYAQKDAAPPYQVRLQVIAISDGVAYYVVLGLHCGPKTTILILILTLQFMALHAIIFIL